MWPRLREAYVNANQGADFSKATRWGVNRLWQEWDDPAAAFKTGTSGHVGMKMNGASAAVAAKMDAALSDAGFTSATAPSSCGAMFDPEPFHPSDVIELLTEWRRRRKTRFTIVTIPPWQAGLIPFELATLINNDPNTLVAVQCYMTYPDGNGKPDDLYPTDPDETVNELVNVARILRSRITKFLPVKGSLVGVEVPYGWSGLLWTFDALPHSPQAPL